MSVSEALRLMDFNDLMDLIFIFVGIFAFSTFIGIFIKIIGIQKEKEAKAELIEKNNKQKVEYKLFCSNCGKPYSPNESIKFCPECGNKF